jgi:hypothetical protein
MTDNRRLMVHDTDQADYIAERLTSQSNQVVHAIFRLGKYVVLRETVAHETPELILVPPPATVRQYRAASGMPPTTRTDTTKSLSKQPATLVGVVEDNEHWSKPDNITPETSPEIIADIVYRMMRRDIVLDRERRPGSDRLRFR